MIYSPIYFICVTAFSLGMILAFLNMLILDEAWK